MTASQIERTVASALDTAATELRIQAARERAIRQRMTLEEMLEWWGGDIVAQLNYPSPASFATAVRMIRDYHGRS